MRQLSLNHLLGVLEDVLPISHGQLANAMPYQQPLVTHLDEMSIYRRRIHMRILTYSPGKKWIRLITIQLPRLFQHMLQRIRERNQKLLSVLHTRSRNHPYILL